MAIRLSSLLHLDGHWLHLFNGVISDARIDGLGSLLGINRFWNILPVCCFPWTIPVSLAPYFHLRNRSYTSVLLFIVSSWLIPFAIWPGSIVLGYYVNKNKPSCVHPAPPYVIVVLCAFFYYIPLLFMLVCYSRIIVNIKNIEVLVSDNQEGSDLIKKENGCVRCLLECKLVKKDFIHLFQIVLWWRSTIRLIKLSFPF